MPPAPQPHTPFEQLLPEGAQLPQAAPPVPHTLPFCPKYGMQTLPLQQPLGQLVASHTQLPPEQRCPAAQALPPPQVQLPLVHASAVVASQVVQLPPPGVPHAPREKLVTQLDPLQQPLAQLDESHTHIPPAQCWPAAHGTPVPHLHWPALLQVSPVAPQSTHAPPPVPHALGF